MIIAACALLRGLAPLAGLQTPPQILPTQRAHCLRPNTHSVQRAVLPVGDPQLPTPRPAARNMARRCTNPLPPRPRTLATGYSESRITPLRI